MTTDQRTNIEREAFDLGRTAAENAASWASDGNETDESRARKLAMLADGDPAVYDYLPAPPGLSGEWADAPTPLSLAREILGIDDPDPVIIDELADAWELGVSETFEQACEAELRRAAD